jgi:hypothetical protein
VGYGKSATFDFTQTTITAASGNQAAASFNLVVQC